MKYAHYFATRNTKYLVLTANPDLSGMRSAQIAVTGKAQARKLAEVLGAKPWNF